MTIRTATAEVEPENVSATVFVPAFGFADITHNMHARAADVQVQEAATSVLLRGDQVAVTQPSVDVVRLTNLTGAGIAVVATMAFRTFAVGSNAQFQVDAHGNLVRMNNVPTTWPATQGSAGFVLTNDGAGNLSWGAAGGGLAIGAPVVGGTDGLVLFVAGGGLLAQGNLEWDDATQQLGSPSVLHLASKGVEMAALDGAPGAQEVKFAGVLTLVDSIAAPTVIFQFTPGATSTIGTLGPVRFDVPSVMAIAGDASGPELCTVGDVTSGLFDSTSSGDEIGVSIKSRATTLFQRDATTTKTHSGYTGSGQVLETRPLGTTDAAPTPLGAWTLSNGSACWFEAFVVARDSTGTDHAAYKIRCCAFRQGGGATLVGTVDVAFVRESAGAGGWDATFAVSGNDVQLQVTGAVATTIYWVATVNRQNVLTNL